MKNKNHKDFEEIKKFFESQKPAGWSDCPDCNPQSRCPYCDPNYRRPDPWRESRCVLNQPLMMVIPPGGVHLSCPAHPAGHHIFGPAVSWMEQPLYKSKPWCEYDSIHGPIDYDSTPKFVEFDSTRSPGSTCTGDTIRDSWKMIS